MPMWTPDMIAYVDGYESGLGLLRATGEPRNKAIKGIADGVTGTVGGSGLTLISRIETTEDLETELGVNASVRGGIGIFKAEDKFEFAKRCKLQRHSVAIIIKSDQITGFFQIDELELTDNAKSLSNQDMAAFVEQYGDCFIRGTKRGGQLFVIIRIDANSEESKQTIKNTLNASVGAFSGDLMVSLNETVKRTGSSTSVLLYNIGGVAAPTNLSTPDQIANVLGPWIMSVQSSPAPFGVMLSPYRLVSGFDPPQPELLEHQQEIIERCDRLRYFAINSLNEIEYVLEHPKNFQGVDVATLNTARGGFASDLDVIAQARAFAVKFPGQAMEPETFARSKLMKPDYKLAALPSPMPDLPSKLFPVPDFTGWEGRDIIWRSQWVRPDGVGTFESIEFWVSGQDEGTEQGNPWQPPRPRDLITFLAYHKAYAFEPSIEYEQGQVTITGQDPPPGSLVLPGDVVTLRWGAPYSGPFYT